MPYPTSWARNDPQKFMCALCFHILDITECATHEDEKIDICVPCLKKEKLVMERAKWLNSIAAERSTVNPLRIKRLKNGDFSFGHAGTHHGIGTEDCPKHRHHHHDEFCALPTMLELRQAGLNPNEFKPKSRE
jgi:hypothetical protein